MGERLDSLDPIASDLLLRAQRAEARITELEALAEQRYNDAKRFLVEKYEVTAELRRIRNQKERYQAALEQIVACDYRGNMPTEQSIARAALTDQSEGQ